MFPSMNGPYSRVAENALGLSIPTIFWITAAGVLGIGLIFGNGSYTPLSLAAVLLALGIAWAGVGLARRGPDAATNVTRVGCVVALAVLGIQLWLDATWAPWGRLAGNPSPATIEQIMIGAAIVMACVIPTGPRLRACGAVVLLGLFAAACFWTLFVAGDPKCDVFTFTKHAIDALLAGQNPYAIHYPLIYRPAMAQTFYPPGVVVNGEVTVGYSYPPLVLLLFLPAHLLGDPRWALIAAMLGTSILLLAIAPGRMGLILAMIYLYSPRNIYMVGQGWVEPFCGFFIVGFVWSLCRGSKWAPYWLGAFLASKQFCALMLPLAWLTLPATRRPAFLLRALGFAVAITLPFFIWNPGAFWEAIVAYHFRNPLRLDALSLAVDAYREWGILLPPALCFILALAATWVVSRGATPGILRFLAGGAVVWLIFFVTAKQAFCNYYYLVIVFLCAAASGSLRIARSGEIPDAAQRIAAFLRVDNRGKIDHLSCCHGDRDSPRDEDGRPTSECSGGW